MITDKMFVGGKDYPLAKVDEYISASAQNAVAELATKKPKVTIR